MPKQGNPTLRPYVSTEDLAVLIEDWLERNERYGKTPKSLTDSGLMSLRALTKIIGRETEWQTLEMADKVMLALDTAIWELTIVEMHPSVATGRFDPDTETEAETDTVPERIAA